MVGIEINHLALTLQENSCQKKDDLYLEDLRIKDVLLFKNVEYLV